MSQSNGSGEKKPPSDKDLVGLLYGVLSAKGEAKLASRVSKIRGATRSTVILELSSMERGASAFSTRWIATAKLAYQGSAEHLDLLEKESMRASNLPTDP